MHLGDLGRWLSAFVLLSAVACGGDPGPPLAGDRADRGSEFVAPGRGPANADMPVALRAAFIQSVQAGASAEHDFERIGPGRVSARAPAQGLALEIGSGGLLVRREVGVHEAARDERSFSLGLRLAAIGDGKARVPLGDPSAGALASENRATLEHRGGLRDNGIEEYYVTGPLGIEQGFVIAAPPVVPETAADPRDSDAGSLVLELEVSGLEPVLAADGREIALVDADERQVLRYTDLVATDATGKAIEAHMEVEAGAILLVVDADAASYPLNIDPLIWVEQAKLTGSDSGAGDTFGASVSVDGDTAVVAGGGAAYVFVRTGTTWAEQQKLTAIDGASLSSVAVYGDTAVAGDSSGDVGTNTNEGTAYVFVRTGTTWSEQQKLVASDGLSGDELGASVSIHGETVLIGAPGDDLGITDDQGSAYVFVRTGTTWSEQQKLVASDVDPYASSFGNSVSLHGDTALVGAANDVVGAKLEQGSAYVFVRAGSTWSEQQKLTASDGVAYDTFGTSVSIDANTALVGAPVASGEQGSAYLFVRSGTTWSEQQKLTASDAAAKELFGFSVSVHGDTALVGASEGNVAGIQNQGAAYVFVRTGSTWSEQDKLTASDGTLNVYFGSAVSLQGNTALVGAIYDDAGSAYVFVLDKKANGEPCALGSECVGGVCLDSLCCDASCQGGVGGGGVGGGAGTGGAGSGAGATTGGASDGDGSPDDDGCSCRVENAHTADARQGWLLLALLVAACARRAPRRGR